MVKYVVLNNGVIYLRIELQRFVK